MNCNKLTVQACVKGDKWLYKTSIYCHAEQINKTEKLGQGKD